MKLTNLMLSMSASLLAIGMVSCENQDISFPDSDGGTSVYFAYQYPVRTLIMGDVETYDNTTDNEHRFTVYGTSGGSYNGLNAVVDVTIDENLIQGLTFEDGSPLVIMPKEYYELSGSQLNYGGDYRGGVEVKLTDAFFNDKDAVTRKYVLPFLMTESSGVDQVLRGTALPGLSNPVRQNAEDWKITPKDYTIFCVNYINKYDANYLRRGVDEYSVPEVSTYTISSADKIQDPWETQLFIASSIEFEEGKDWELTMDVKADIAASIGTQTHKEPGNYLHWAAIGNVDFSTEWTTKKFTGTFSAEQNGGKSVAFNLNDLAEANNFYVKNISFTIDGQDAMYKSDDNSIVSGNIYKKEKNGAVIALSNPHPAMNEKIVRHKQFVEKDEVVKTSSKDYNTVVLPVEGLMCNGVPVSCDLLLTFNENGECTITSATAGYTATGSGVYKSKSETKAWGDKDRDGLYLNYKIDLGGYAQYSTSDTLVWRDRGTAASAQTYRPVYK
ncbi:MAG: DUF5627 domain-containing protein [Bacteroidales bacterium]|nr:DUF5627 domain-containing protein [Bacteroidales bacterium]